MVTKIMHGPLTRYVKLRLRLACFHRHRLQRKPLVSDPGMHDGTCVTHVPWCMTGSVTHGCGKTFPAFQVHAQSAILRIWQEAHLQSFDSYPVSMDFNINKNAFLIWLHNLILWTSGNPQPVISHQWSWLTCVILLLISNIWTKKRLWYENWGQYLLCVAISDNWDILLSYGLRC